MSKKIFEVDITSFEELQDLITEYFEIFRLLLTRENVRILKIKLDIDSDKVVIEAEEVEEDSEESTEYDFEWI
tara:strand:+ start:2587 stop:2805 length:219 start_codon:yes stop_codon:yes gene_type:complete